MSRPTPRGNLKQDASESPELSAAGSHDEWAAATAAAELTHELLGGLEETLQEEDVPPVPMLPRAEAK